MTKKLSILAGLIIYSLSAAASVSVCDLIPQQQAVLVNTSDWILKQAFLTKKSGIQVQDQAIVTRLLTDDLNGGRHQRFILRLSSGQTLLIAHNIDIAPRVPGLRIGDSLVFYGQYEWSSQGGVVHWTHRDPSKKHVTGWLKYKNKTYQ
jgi:hypothetical protein